MGDNSRIEELYREFGGAVYRRCLRMLGNSAEAEGAMQEVFLRMLPKLDTLQDGDKAANYLFRVSTNFCLNRLRTQRRRLRTVELDEHIADPVSNPEDVVVNRRLLADCLAGLTRRPRLVVYLHLLEGLTQAEVAEAAGLSRQHVGRIIRAFRRRVLQGGENKEADDA